ncbi:MAG TPA: hypothetical protein V6D23_24410, partial [Candidatus Obscuribacterales bacterium]
MPTISATPKTDYTTDPFKASKPASDTTKPGTKPEVPQVVKDLCKDEVKVSPFITIPGSALTSGLVGAATGAGIAAAIDIFSKGGALKEAVSAGSLLGGASGVVSGAVIAHMAQTKTQATLYSALAGFGTGAVIGGAKSHSLPM